MSLDSFSRGFRLHIVVIFIHRFVSLAALKCSSSTENSRSCGFRPASSCKLFSNLYTHWLNNLRLLNILMSSIQILIKLELTTVHRLCSLKALSKDKIVLIDRGAREEFTIVSKLRGVDLNRLQVTVL